MAADASNDLGGVAQTLAGATLAQLTTRRRSLDILMQKAPADASQEIDQAHRTIESIRTRKQAWNDVSRTDQVDPRQARRARGAIVALDRAHALAYARLDRAERQQAHRHEWFDTHADLVAEHQLVRRAERARETQVRITAINTPEPAVRDVLGPEPTIQRQRLLWRRAVETTAVYKARHRDLVIRVEGGVCEQLLGARPADHRAASDYDRAAAAIKVAVASDRASGPHEADLGVAL
jgi:hypothetical protein